MIQQPLTESIPIHQDEQGQLRVGESRILLDLVIYAYHQGNTPETIIDNYPTLTLDDVYFALGYYLRHRDQIDMYLSEQEAEIERLRQHDLIHHPPKLTREILLERLKQRQQQDKA